MFSMWLKVSGAIMEIERRSEGIRDSRNHKAARAQ
jgi:hypothetical protein